MVTDLVTDLTGTTWMFTDEVGSEMQGNGNFYIDFVCNGQQYTYIGTDWKPNAFSYNDTLVYSWVTNTWNDEAYKTITITGGTDATNFEFIMWLGAYATQQTVSRKSIDLTTLPAWESLPAGDHTITIVAKADGYRDSVASEGVVVTKAPEIEMPVKGDLIYLNMNGSGPAQYRVLKTNGTVAEVLGMTDLTTMAYNATSKTTGFEETGTIGQAYAESDLDNYLNSTWYDSLSEAAKIAIVPKNIVQKMYSFSWTVDDTATYTGIASDGDDYQLVYTDQVTVGDRYVYALDCEEVVDYTGNGTSNLTYTNIWQMFWNAAASQSGKYIWLRSPSSANSSLVFNVYGLDGSLVDSNVSLSLAARPAFQIDLSKIEFTK